MEAGPAPLLATLFGTHVAAAETRHPGDTALLYAEEASHVARAIAKRAGEFAAGRLCARSALRSLGIENFPLLVGADRRPQWPADIVGSITHTRGYYAAVAARSEHYAAIGIDAERIGRVGPHLWKGICTEAEIAWIESLEPAQRPRLGALVFSAKEAFYKCQFGLTGAWVGFHDVELRPADCDFDAGRFAVWPLVPLVLDTHRAAPWRGQCRFEPDLVLSGMAFGAAVT